MLAMERTTRRHQRQRQSAGQNHQRQLQHPLTTAARCALHHARVSHSYRVDTLASARVAHCALLIFIPAVQFAVHLPRMVMRVFLLMTLCTLDVIAKIICRFCTAV